ncbi:hypothetical protein BC834DRAFT_845633 [Gloeopeniophorella convolvens]|nr:hypothetical protein BC834DRAFT_845633 [Gloeopeniophorella convolvens]
MFPRFLRPIQVPSRRAYSLFSKPPGGRFFNSSKPPKVVPASTKQATRVEAGSANTTDPSQTASAAVSTPDDALGSSTHSTPPVVPPLPAPPASLLASHPPLGAPDLRLHQFFSQHRPLVLAQPVDALFESVSSLALGPAPPTPPAEELPEATPEADADTARLLARALAMNAVSSSVSWEATLRRLGLDPAAGREAENAALEGLAVELDSTKRKRRKKMKKHKLKKRRRLQRSQRLKMGR